MTDSTVESTVTLIGVVYRARETRTDLSCSWPRLNVTPVLVSLIEAKAQLKTPSGTTSLVPSR